MGRPDAAGEAPAAPSRWSGRSLLLAVAALALTVAAFELFTLAGLDYRGVFRTSVPFEHGPLVRPDPELRYIAKPHLHDAGSHRGGDIAIAWHLRGDDLSTITWDVRLDRDGFRNRDGLTTAPVAVVGDSFVLGDRVTASEVVTAVLADRLGADVVNLGHNGYGPQQELVVLRRFALRYGPRVVFWLLYEGNDLRDHAWFEVTRPRWDAMVADHASFAKRSFLRNAAVAVGRVLTPEPEVEIANRRWGRLPDGRRMWFLRAAEGWTDWELAAHDDLGDILREAAAACATANASLVVVFVPDKFRVYRDVCSFPPHSECRGWVPNDFPERLAATVATIEGVGFVDLTPSFRARAGSPDLLYLPDDTHWTATGHRVAGEALAAHVRERRLVEDGRDSEED